MQHRKAVLLMGWEEGKRLWAGGAREGEIHMRVMF